MLFFLIKKQKINEVFWFKIEVRIIKKRALLFK